MATSTMPFRGRTVKGSSYDEIEELRTLGEEVFLVDRQRPVRTAIGGEHERARAARLGSNSRFLARNGAPGRTRTCDPRLRMVSSRVGSGCLVSRLRGLPRGRATRLICPASPRTRLTHAKTALPGRQTHQYSKSLGCNDTGPQLTLLRPRCCLTAVKNASARRRTLLTIEQ